MAISWCLKVIHYLHYKGMGCKLTTYLRVQNKHFTAELVSSTHWRNSNKCIYGTVRAELT